MQLQIWITPKANQIVPRSKANQVQQPNVGIYFKLRNYMSCLICEIIYYLYVVMSLGLVSPGLATDGVTLLFKN